MPIIENVAVLPHSYQRCTRTIGGRCKQVHRQIASTNAVGIIKVEDGRQVFRKRRYQLRVIDAEGKPIDVSRRSNITCDGNRSTICRQNVTQLLRRQERVVIPTVDLGSLTDKWRMTRHPAQI